MYDNIDFNLSSVEARGVNLLRDIPKYFDVTGEHIFDNGISITGNLHPYKIAVTDRGISIKDGSLCKYHFGDNFQTLGIADTRQAIEHLSDTLHLPIERAKVTRVDIAQNFVMKHPPEMYFSHLGELKHSKRAICSDTTLYYYQSNGLLIFYNKVAEQKAKGQNIPELYTGRHTLRYEQRYKQRIAKTLKVEAVTGALLYDERFYIDLINRWRDNYRAINKINDVSLNFEAMKGKKELYTMGVLALAQMAGGELGLQSQITEAQKSGRINKKQAFDMRQAIKGAFAVQTEIVAPNEAIVELTKKIDEASRFYR